MDNEIDIVIDLKAIRKKFNLTRQEMADFLGTNNTTVYRWEMNRKISNKNFLRYYYVMSEVLKKDLVTETFLVRFKVALHANGPMLAIHELLKLYFDNP